MFKFRKAYKSEKYPALSSKLKQQLRNKDPSEQQLYFGGMFYSINLILLHKAHTIKCTHCSMLQNMY